MEYRRLGQTGLWVSAVCLGGHWKRIDKITRTQSTFMGYDKLAQAADDEWKVFHQNRWDVVTRCLEVGINLIDCAATTEPQVYAKALEGRREKMYFAATWGSAEFRDPAGRSADKMLQCFEEGLRVTGLEYIDLWRVMVLERGGLHTDDRLWAKKVIEQYPGMIQVLCTPYTADSKELPTDSLFETVKQQDVGVLGIKPFASNSLFAGDGAPDSPHAAEDDKRARLAIRYILANPAITAPIPGLVSVHQVDNMVKAVRERRELGAVEELERRRVAEEMWAKLPPQYEWLRDWRNV
jgi:aryl-alcohol dehydrogenase-like predicted oxidoreductase